MEYDFSKWFIKGREDPGLTKGEKLGFRFEEESVLDRNEVEELLQVTEQSLGEKSLHGGVTDHKPRFSTREYRGPLACTHLALAYLKSIVHSQ